MMKFAALALLFAGTLGCTQYGPPGSELAKGLAISHDGSRIAIGGIDHLILVKEGPIDVATKVYGKFDHGSVLAPRFDPTGQFVFFWSAESYKLDLGTGTPHIISKSVDTSMRFAEDISEDGQLRLDNHGLVDNIDNTPLLSLSYLTSNSASADFTYIGVPTSDWGDLQIQLFRVDEKKLVALGKKKVDGYGSIEGIAIEGSPPIIVYFDGGRVFLLLGEEMRQESLATSVGTPTAAAITPDGRLTVVFGSSGIEVLESATRNSLSDISATRARHCKISGNGKRLAVIDEQDHLFLYSLPDLVLVLDVDLQATLAKLEGE